MISQKLCRKCETVKAASEFSPCRGKKDGHQEWCKDCFTSYARARRAIAEANRPSKPPPPSRLNEAGERLCSRCREYLPQERFAKGSKYACKPCASAAVMESYARKAAKTGSTAIVERMVEGAKHRAIKFGREFSITAADLGPIPERCPILDIPITPDTGTRGGTGNSPTIDRIDNSKGYVPGNVWIISKKANCMKHKSSVEELRAMLVYKEKVDLLPGSGTVTP